MTIARPSIGAALAPFRAGVTYIRSSIEELKKATWPSREQAIQYTTIVIVSVLVVAGITSALDLGLSKAVQALITWSQRV